MMKNAVLSLAITMSGCLALGGQKTVIRVDRDEPPVLAGAPATGTYGLFSSGHPSPILTVELMEGDRLGFLRIGDRLAGVAGEVEVPLAGGGAYDWRRVSEADGGGNTEGGTAR